MVNVVGFNETEHRLLTSIFGLAARHDPSFRQRDPASNEPVDLYLVDVDNEAAMRLFQLMRSRHDAPAVLIGGSDRGTGLLLLARPIQWARLLQAFEESMLGEVRQGNHASEQNAGADPADNEKTLVLRRTTTSAPRTIPPHTSLPMPQTQRAGPNAGTDPVDYEKTLVLRRTTTSAPRTPAPHTPPTRASSPVPPTQRPGPAAPAARTKQFTDLVLVVDDNATVRKFMEAKLAPYRIRGGLRGIG